MNAWTFLAYVAVGCVALVFAAVAWAAVETRRYDRETDSVPDVHGDVPAIPPDVLSAALEDARARASEPPPPPFLPRCFHDYRGECATCYVARTAGGKGTP